MQLTNEQLASAKSSLDNEVRLIKWIEDNNIDLTPRDLLSQLREKYGQEEIQKRMQVLRSANIGLQFKRQIERMVENRVKTVKQCDSLTEVLTECLVVVAEKKAELE
jgi:hypothetical protein